MTKFAGVWGIRSAHAVLCAGMTLLAAAGCGSSSGGEPAEDSGLLSDAGVDEDGGVVQDAGPGDAQSDTGSLADAADANTDTDAQIPQDANSDAADAGSDASDGAAFWYDPATSIPIDRDGDGVYDAFECKPGFTLSGELCADVDECATNHGGCDAHVACTNAPGSFACGACPAGFAGDGVHGCSDVDECVLNSDNCSADATCGNTEGSFTCTCHSGYVGDGVNCADVDECELGTDDCDANATCENTVGGFACECDDGYVGDGKSCTSTSPVAVADTRTVTPNVLTTFDVLENDALGMPTATVLSFGGGALGGAVTDVPVDGPAVAFAGGTLAVTSAGRVAVQVATSGTYTFSYRLSNGATSDALVSIDVCVRLAVGGTFVARPQELPQVCLRSADGGAGEYLLIPMNLSAHAAYPLGVLAANITAIAGAAAPSAGTASATDGHTALRSAQHAEIAGRLGTSGAGTALSPSALVTPGVPEVGDTYQLNVELDTACTNGTGQTGTVRVVGRHGILVTDDSNPADGLSQAELEEYVAAFDTVIYPSVSGLFGAPTDVDGNERIVLFMTAAMNRLSPASSAVIVPARHLPRDLATQSECPTSNQGEILYLLAPDPNGTIHSNPRSVSYVKGSTLGPLAHEFGHLIVDTRRAGAGSPFAQSWLDEALAGEAEERAFFANTALSPPALTPGQNIDLAALTTGASAVRRVAAFNAYENNLYTKYRTWLQAPARVGALDATSTTVSQRGAAWAFLRYAADRHAAGSSSAEAGFFYDLANAEETGLDALDALTGADPSLWLRDFLVAVYADDAGIPELDVASLPYRVASWNYRSVYATLGGFPLQLPTLSPGVATSISLGAGGTANYLQLGVPASTAAALTFSSPSSGTWDAWYVLLRKN